MILAAFRDNAYDIVLTLHILTMFVAFAPAGVHPFLGAQAADDEHARRWFYRHAARNGRIFYSPALIVGGLLGILLIFLSDDIIEFSELWISLSFLGWIAILGILHGMIMPNERRVGEGDDAAEKRIQLGGQLVTLLLVVMLYLMIFKPGTDTLGFG